MQLSVVIPAHNSVKCLERVIQSLTYITVSHEIIICENNSSDGTYEFALILKEKYSSLNITVIKSKATSVGAALNDGLEAARGDFIHFVDSDDEVYSQEYKGILNEIKDKDFDFIQLKYTLYDAKMKKHMYIRPHRIFTNIYWNKIYRRSFLRMYDIKFEDGILNQDGVFNGYVRSQDCKVLFSDILIYKYYVNDSDEGSVSDSVRMKTINGFVCGSKNENIMIHENIIKPSHMRHHCFYRFLAFDCNDPDFDEAFEKLSNKAINMFMSTYQEKNVYSVNKNYAFVMYVALINEDKQAVKILQANHKKFLHDIEYPNQRDYLQVENKNDTHIIMHRQKEVFRNIVMIKNNSIRNELFKAYQALHEIQCQGGM